MFTFGKRPILDPEIEEFHVQCWAWLLRNTPHRRFDKTPLVLPTTDYFTSTQSTGPDLGTVVFSDVCRLARIEAPYLNLIPELRAKNTLQDSQTGSLCSPAGTFGVEHDEHAEIRYDVALADDPKKLILVFAHELGHLINGAIPEVPPGGRSNTEVATDLTATYLGFGAFHSAFLPIGTDRRGFVDRETGKKCEYLSILECAFDLGVFCLLRQFDPAPIKPFVTWEYWTDVNRSIRYLKASGRIQEIIALRAKPDAARNQRNFWIDRDERR